MAYGYGTKPKPLWQGLGDHAGVTVVDVVTVVVESKAKKTEAPLRTHARRTLNGNLVSLLGLIIYSKLCQHARVTCVAPAGSCFQTAWLAICESALHI